MPLIYMSTDGFRLMASRKNGLRGSDWFFLTGENWLVFPGEKWLFYPVANILERISEAPHEHVFGDNPEYTPSSMGADYHSAPTKCEGDLHPAFDCIFEHRFDSESETPEICLDCGAEKSYRIEIGQRNGGYSTVDYIYVTKSKGFTLGNTYTSESGTTYTGITEWKNETTGESYDIGKKITPTEDGMVLVFTIGSSKT